MYDAIIVGARCAGASTAMLLARKGHRVLLVDGFTRATWRIVRDVPAKKGARSGRDARGARGAGAGTDPATATLVIEPFVALSNKDTAAVTAEGHRLLKFAASDAASHDVRINPPA